MTEDSKNLIGQSFDNQALTGSGTILADGTYGENLPDPTEVRGVGPRRTSGGRLVQEPPSSEVEDALNPENAKRKTDVASSAPAKSPAAKGK